MARARRAAAVVTSSEFVRGEITRVTAIKPAHVRLVRPGAPPSGQGRSRAGSAEDLPAELRTRAYALVVGINKPHKNLETLAAAWRRFGETPPLALVSAGPRDPRYPDLAEFARRSGARDVTALGLVDEQTQDALYANAALVLFPSRHEGLDFPPVEAFARVIPAVVVDIPSLREIGAGAARFVPPASAGAWFEAVRDLAADAPARAALAAAAKDRAAGLSYADSASRMRELFREVAA